MKVSAIIPAYNAEPWIEEAVTSIKTQSRPVHELIVVDDASTDRTGELARALGADVIRLDVNSGEGAARNAGIRRATGDLIAWLDADDLWAANHVETLAGLLEKFPEATVSCAAVQRFGLRDDLHKGQLPVEAPGNVFWRAARTWVHPIIGAIMRRDALVSIGGFSTKHRASVDYDMWLRLSRDHLFISTREATSYWRWHPMQQSQNFGAQLQAVYDFRRDYLDTELAGKHPEDAARFAELMREMWKTNLTAALKAEDRALALSVFEIRDLIPGLDPAEIADFQSRLQAT